MRHQHREPQDLTWPAAPSELIGIQQLMDGDEVTERLAHLLALDLQKAVVHPVARHLLRAVGAARLRDLVFVVGKDKVDTATVNIEYVAQVLTCHRRALNVPPRTSWRIDPAWRWPRRLSRL